MHWPWGLHLGRGHMMGSPPRAGWPMTQGQTQSPTGVRSSGNLRWWLLDGCCGSDDWGQQNPVFKWPKKMCVFFFALKEVGFFGVISSNLQWLVDYNLMKKTGTWRIGTQWRVSVVKSARWFFVRPQAFVHNPFHSWPKFMANKGGPELPSPTTGPTSEPRKNPTNTFHFIGCFMGFFIMVYYTPHING